jgi:hypothetical protein
VAERSSSSHGIVGVLHTYNHDGVPGGGYSVSGMLFAPMASRGQPSAASMQQHPNGPRLRGATVPADVPKGAILRPQGLATWQRCCRNELS